MKEEKVEQKMVKRKTIFNINPIIFNRWSSRSMTGEELEDDIIMSLFEAVRWVPSSYNN
ncbi:MAG TPA: hypothetical protein VN704_05895 [Verrucomicrobiae bacterium]|nr:hypothetical protein [Verrucomicrobiae bacterium]